jgi:hypothetical protein
VAKKRPYLVLFSLFAVFHGHGRNHIRYIDYFPDAVTETVAAAKRLILSVDP